MALRITKALNPAARDMVDENLQKTLKNEGRTATSKNKAFSITELTLLALADLEDPAQVQPALQVVLDDHLKTDQAAKMVEWVQAGNPPETFGSAPKTPPAKKAPGIPPEALDKAAELGRQWGLAEGRGEDTKPAQDQLNAYLAEVKTAHANDNHNGPLVQPILAPPPVGSGQVPDEKPSWIWKRLLGIKFISQLRSKVKKGEPLTPTEKWFAVLYGIYKFFEPLLKSLKKRSGKLFKEALKAICDAFIKACGKTFSKIMKWAVVIVIVCALIWAMGKIYQYTIANPLHWLESKVRSGFHWGGSTPQIAPTPVPASSSTSLIFPTVPLTVRSSKLKHKTSNSELLTTNSNVVAYQPAASFIPNPSSPKTLSPMNTTGTSSPRGTPYDPKIFELEIASVPKNSIVKDFPLTPDEGMPADVALSRMQDVIDPDKYTMFIGGSKEIIKSVNSGNTTLTILYNSADPLDFWGSKGLMNFLWEDVKYIHANEISPQKPGISSHTGTQDTSIYQCSLVVSGSKFPLTIQCATPDDLEHLVSTMQYFIRLSRLSRDTALGGMPYPTQGVRLNNDCVVEKLWAGSPMANAGLQPGEMIWSLDKNPVDQPDRKKLEAALAALTPGSHIIFVVSPDDRDKAQSDVSFGRARDFNPRRRKVVLITT